MNIYVAISLGLLKIAIILSLLFFVTRKFFLLKRDFSYIFDTLVRKYFEYISLLIVILFITINLKVYDGIVVGLTLFLFALWDYLGVQNPKEIPNLFKLRFKRRLLVVIKNLEQNTFSWVGVFKNDHLKLHKKNLYILYSLSLLLLVIVLISYYFIRFDQYLFSSSWFDTLEMVNAKDANKWFTRDIFPEGVPAFINYLSHLTNSSPEITIYVFSIFQLLLLVLLIFWYVQKITGSEIIVPVFVAVFYIVGFTYLPSDITNFYQNSATHFALTLVFPLLYYIMKPKVLPYGVLERRFKFFIVFMAISLIDLYVFLFVVPLFLIMNIIVYYKSKLKFEIITIYILSFVSAFLIYYHFLQTLSLSIYDLLRRVVIAVELNFNNTFIPIPIDKLLFYYQLLFIVSFILNVVFAVFYGKKWKKRIFIFFFTIIVYALTQINSQWLDHDLLFKLLSVFIPIQFGVSLSNILDLIKFKKFKNLYVYRGGFIIVITISTFALLQKTVLLSKRDTTQVLNEDILSANEIILKKYLDRTYTVVNKDEYLNLSSGRRYFITYDEFLENKYLERDILYAKYVNNNKYLFKHPEIILPSSVFVFLYKTNEIGTEKYNNLIRRMSYLQSIGRPVKIIFKTKQLTVYEVVNKPKSSKVFELVF